MPAASEDILEADEMWSFVYERWNKRWVWTAMCRRTRQVIAFAIGDRDEATCRRLWEKIPSSYQGCQSYSDFWEAYQLVFPAPNAHRPGVLWGFDAASLKYARNDMVKLISKGE